MGRELYTHCRLSNAVTPSIPYGYSTDGSLLHYQLTTNAILTDCRSISVLDPDLELRGGGGGAGQPDPEIRGRGAQSPKNFFCPSGLSLI